MITSRQNQSFKYWMRLKQKKYRDEYRRFLIYGEHQIEKAKKYNLIDEIIREDIELSKDLMKDLQQTETSFSIMAVCEFPRQEIKSNKVLILDDVQDPKNVGSLIRSASAFGFLEIFASYKTADFFNEKTIRASKGAIFDVSLKRGNIIDYMKNLKLDGYKIYAADAHEGTSTEVTGDKLALVLGNEGYGLNDKTKALCNSYVNIKTNNVESLNVSIAGSILMYLWSEK